ncbi:unnamed protein product [Discosporangium mesarthrocarpum]
MANFESALRERILLVAVSSRACHKCIRFEPEYQAASEELEQLGVHMGRVDADLERDLLHKICGHHSSGAQNVPVLVLYNSAQGAKGIIYDGPHERNAIIEYVYKQLGQPFQQLTSVGAVMRFIESPFLSEAGHSGSSAAAVVGFFADAEGLEEDEMEDFREASLEMKSKPDVYMAVVNSATVAQYFKELGWIYRTPSIYLSRQDLPSMPALHLDEVLEGNASLKDWIMKESLPLVGQLTNNNFAHYERMHLPMLIMFLDLSDGTVPNSQATLRGKSGGVSNRDLVQELEEAAKEHRDRLIFLYADGNIFADSMKSLGLFGDKERLPQIAFNTMDGRQYPFPEELPINQETILRFCAAFLSGRLRTTADAKRALISNRPINTHNTVHRSEAKQAPKEIRGISEQFKPHDPVAKVTKENFETIALDDEHDVLIMFHSQECERCSHMVPYYKRVGERFQDLGISTMVIAAMDVTQETPPPKQGIHLPRLPAILLLPAQDKGPPYRFFSGIGKVGPLMRWLEDHASLPFDLPTLPHLSEEEKPLFRQQVVEREEYLSREAKQ